MNEQKEAEKQSEVEHEMEQMEGALVEAAELQKYLLGRLDGVLGINPEPAPSEDAVEEQLCPFANRLRDAVVTLHDINERYTVTLARIEL